MNSTRWTRRELLTGGSALWLSSLVGGAAHAAGGPVTVGSRAPELIGKPGDWINTSNQALTLYGKNGLLQKGPVLIDFWEYTCVNCIRTLPYLREWSRRYAGKGLTIVGIHTPEFDFAKEKDNVADAVRTFDLSYPVVNDAGYANWNAWGNQYWPRKYLLDKTGRVVYDHAGEGGYGETEAQIQKALKAANPRVALPALMEPVRGADKPGAVCYPQTPEIYAGYERGGPQFGTAGGFRRDADFTYALAGGGLSDGKFYVRGQWRSLPESIRHARATDDPLADVVVLPYRALEANAVIKPEGGAPFDLFLQQDGKPLDRNDKGADVRYTADGRSFVHVDAPRMYGLVKNRKWGRHELRLGSSSPAFGLYSFTFSSCEVGGSS